MDNESSAGMLCRGRITQGRQKHLQQAMRSFWNPCWPTKLGPPGQSPLQLHLAHSLPLQNLPQMLQLAPAAAASQQLQRKLLDMKREIKTLLLRQLSSVPVNLAWPGGFKFKTTTATGSSQSSCFFCLMHALSGSCFMHPECAATPCSQGKVALVMGTFFGVGRAVCMELVASCCDVSQIHTAHTAIQ